MKTTLAFLCYLVDKTVSPQRWGVIQRAFVLWFGLFCCTSECVPVIALSLSSRTSSPTTDFNFLLPLSSWSSVCHPVRKHPGPVAVFCEGREKMCTE